jgi:L-aspartate oxidase
MSPTRPGWAVQQALERAAAANPNIVLLPDMVAVDLITGRHEERFSTEGRCTAVRLQSRGPGRWRR